MVKIDIRDGWKSELVAVRPPSGRDRFLLAVQKEACPYCGTGVRTISIWSTAKGFAEQIAWCGHCFNATCRQVSLPVEQRRRCAGLEDALGHQPTPVYYDAARPALEDLERRGLL